MSLWTRLVRLIKIKLKQRKRPEDPLAVLKHRLKLMDQSLQELKRSSLKLGKSKILLEHRARDLDRYIKKYEDSARQALHLGREDLAELALKNKHQALSIKESYIQKIQSLDEQIRSLDQVQDGLINEIKLYKTKKEELELRLSATQAELSAQEVRLGLSQEEILDDIHEAIARFEGEIRNVQAQVEASREFTSQLPRPPFTSEETDLALEGEGDREAIAAEIERIKRELEESSS